MKPNAVVRAAGLVQAVVAAAAAAAAAAAVGAAADLHPLLGATGRS